MDIRTPSAVGLSSTVFLRFVLRTTSTRMNRTLLLSGDIVRKSSGVQRTGTKHLYASSIHIMSTPIEELVDPEFVGDLQSLSLDEIRLRRGKCQDAEEALSFQRRMVQGRLDIVQADLYRRTGSGHMDVADLVQSLPDILVEHGDRHLGPGRLTSVDTNKTQFGDDFEDFSRRLDEIVSGARLSELAEEDEATVRSMADDLDQLERAISKNRHKLHAHIDLFQAEIVRRYKSGEESVEGLLGS